MSKPALLSDAGVDEKAREKKDAEEYILLTREILNTECIPDVDENHVKLIVYRGNYFDIDRVEDTILWEKLKEIEITTSSSVIAWLHVYKMIDANRKKSIMDDHHISLVEYAYDFADDKFLVKIKLRNNDILPFK